MGSVTLGLNDVLYYPQISTHTLRGERDARYQDYQSNKTDFNSHAPWGAWLFHKTFKIVVDNFNSHAPWGAWLQLSLLGCAGYVISTHTLRGERDLRIYIFRHHFSISTHTLRGERDLFNIILCFIFGISTHTLRGERDFEPKYKPQLPTISTHTLRGERD